MPNSKVNVCRSEIRNHTFFNKQLSTNKNSELTSFNSILTKIHDVEKDKSGTYFKYLILNIEYPSE